MGLIKSGIQLGGAFAIAKTVTNAIEKHDREKYNHPQNFSSPPPQQGSTNGQQHQGPAYRDQPQQYAPQEGYQYQQGDQNRSVISSQDRAIEYDPHGGSSANQWSQKPHQSGWDMAQQALQQSPQFGKK